MSDKAVRITPARWRWPKPIAPNCSTDAAHATVGGPDYAANDVGAICHAQHQLTPLAGDG